jgi:hypothetical protein
MADVLDGNADGDGYGDEYDGCHYRAFLLFNLFIFPYIPLLLSRTLIEYELNL